MALQQRQHASAGDETVSQRILIPLEMPADLVKLRLPKGVDERLYHLLDRQDQGEELTTSLWRPVARLSPRTWRWLVYRAHSAKQRARRRLIRKAARRVRLTVG